MRLGHYWWYSTSTERGLLAKDPDLEHGFCDTVSIDIVF